MSDARFCIYMDKDDKIANFKLDIEASGNDIMNMFYTLLESHPEIIPSILNGIEKATEDKTLN